MPRLALPGIITVFAALVVLTLPTYPYLINDALSEKAVLMHAHEHGWHFGTDIVFSYGPLGFLASRNFFAHAAGLRFAVDLLFSFVVCAGVISLAWRMKPLWRWLLITTFVFLNANIDPRYDLLLYLGVFSWAILCFLACGPQLAVAVASLGALTAFGVLVKGNFLLFAAMNIPVVTTDLLLRRRLGAALGLVLATFACFFIGWFTAGQTWDNLPPFFSHLPALASGYNGAVGLDGLQILRSRGLLAIILLALAAWFRASTAYGSVEPSSPPTLFARRAILALWLGGLLLLIWKHGFVRADLFHMGFFFGFGPFCALALEALPSDKSWSLRIHRILAVSCWVVVLFTLQRWCFAPLPWSLIQPFRCFAANASILAHPYRFQTASLERQSTAFSSLDLPATRQIAGTATVDVFGQGQLYALYNHLNYHPRPVFQSYMGYNLDLDRLNEQFYLSAAAPEYVLFQLTPIDHKFPPLEDSLVLRDLLLNYDLSTEESPCLLLKRKSVAPPRLTLLRKTTAHIGERVDLTSFGETNLWMEISLQPSLRGRLRSFFYKPAVTRLAVWSGQSKAAYKAPAPMLAAGFVASPLLIDGDAVRKFYTGEKLERPDGYSIHLDAGTQFFWQPTYECRIYALDSESTPRGLPDR